MSDPAQSDLGAQQPEFVGLRCVHMHIAHATCQACVSVCPRQALALGEEALELDAEACDACGLCAAACPQEAIRLPRYADAVTTREGATAFLACDRAGVEGGRDTVPCLHALGWSAVMRLYVRGMRELVVTHGDCDRCPRGNAPALAHTLRHVNDLLCTRQLPAIALRTLACDQWQVQSAVSSRAREISPRRRAFLQRLVAPAQVERASEAPEPREALLRAGDLGTAIFPAVPVIDPTRCDGCDACVHMCPTGALAQDEAGERVRYRMDAAHCTGCGICVDVCLPKAVSVLRWTSAPQRVVDLQAARCPACGVTYHAPKLRPDRYCRVCTTTNHHRNLFQRDPT